MPGFVSIVGAGPWDPELLTLAGLRRLQSADVVIADYLANPNLLLHAPPGCEVIQRLRGPATGSRLPQPQLNALMVERARAGAHVVRLKGGDPCMFGRGAEEAQVLRDAGIAFEFVPGVSSPIAAPQSAGIPVTHRDHTPAVTFVSGYEAYDKAGLHVEWEHLARSAGTLVLMMSIKNARENAARLVAAGRKASTPAAVVRWGTRGIQQTVTGTLATIADEIARHGVRAPAVLIVGDVVGLRERLAWMDTRPLFGRRVVLTRAFDAVEPFARRLAALGADVALVPGIRIDPPSDLAALDHTVGDLASYDGIVFSSRNGVRAFFESLARLGLDIRRLAGKHVAVVGRSTAAEARTRGLQPDIVPDAARSEGIVESLRRHGSLGRAWLHVRADTGRDTLRSAIEADGGRYTLAIGYRIVRPPVSPGAIQSLLPPERGGDRFDAICFASGQTARNFVTTVDEALGEGTAVSLLASAVVVSLGPVTTAALERLGIEHAVTAPTPDDDGCLTALRSELTPQRNEA